MARIVDLLNLNTMLDSCLKKAQYLAISLLLAGCNFGFLSFSEKSEDPSSKVQIIVPKALSVISAETAEVGLCLIGEVIALDDKGKAAQVLADELVSLSIQGGSVSLFSDDQCLTPVTSVTLLKGQSRGSFYMKPLASAAFTAVALSQKLGFNSKFLTTFRNPRKIAFMAAPSDTEGGYCGTAITVGVQDALGDPIGYTGSLPITGLAAGAAYSNTTCTTGVTSLVFAGEQSKTFYLKNMTIQAMNPTVTVPAAVGATLTGSLTATIQNRSAPFSLFLDSIPAGLVLGDLSATAAQIRVKDSGGAFMTPTAALTVAIAKKAATEDVQFKDPTVATAPAATINLTLNSANAAKTFQVRPIGTSRPASVNFQASATYRGIPMAVVESGNQAVAVVTRGVRIINTDASPATVGAGACSKIFTVSLVDGIGATLAPTVATAVNLDPDAADGFAFYSDNKCTTQIASNSVTIPANVDSANFYFKDTKDDANVDRDITGSAMTFTSPAFRVQIRRQPLVTETAFGASGFRDFSIDGGQDVMSAMAQSASAGKFIAVGRSRVSGASPFRLSAAVITAHGALDTSFNGLGT